MIPLLFRNRRPADATRLIRSVTGDAYTLERRSKPGFRSPSNGRQETRRGPPGRDDSILVPES